MRKRIIGAGMAALVLASGFGVAAAQAVPATTHGSDVSAVAKADHGKPDSHGNKGKAVAQQAKQLAKQLRNLGARLDRQAALLAAYPDVVTGLEAIAGQARDLVAQVNAATTKAQLKDLRQARVNLIREAGRLLDTVDPADLAELPENLQPAPSGV